VGTSIELGHIFYAFLGFYNRKGFSWGGLTPEPISKYTHAHMAFYGPG